MDPTGFRFHPTDQELIGHYLFIKNNSDSVPKSGSFLWEYDMYGEVEPWTIWEAYGGPLLDEQHLFFFTRLKKHGGHRINRRIGSGTWSQGEPFKSVYAKNNQETPIGKKTKLRYENKNVTEQNGCWFMDEYSTVDYDGDYVICRLRENPGKRPSPASSSKPSDHKRKCQADPKPCKKTKSWGVSYPQSAVTTNEAGKTASLKQRPHSEKRFDTVEYETQQYMLSQGIDYALDEVQRDALAPGAVLEQQHTCASSFAQPNLTDDVFVSENESVNAQLEDTDWLGDALEDVEGDTLFPALSEKQTSLMSQMQDIPSQENIIESQEFGFSYDDDFSNLPMDPAYVNSDEFSNYIFGDECLSGGDEIGTRDILHGSSSFSHMLEDQHHEV